MVLIKGDSDNWNPYGGETGLKDLPEHLLRSFRERGWIRWNPDSQSYYWWFETRGIQKAAFKEAKLRYADESVDSWKKMNDERKRDLQVNPWKILRERVIASGVGDSIDLRRRRWEVERKARALLARRRGFLEIHA